MTKKQSLGCLGLAAMSSIVAMLSLVLGIICLLGDDIWNCAAFVTIVPGALLVIAYVSARFGLRAREQVSGPPDFGFTRMEERSDERRDHP